MDGMEPKVIRMDLPASIATPAATMSDMDTQQFEHLAARARALTEPGPGGARRRILGLAGPPGAGKSTLAARLVDRLGGLAVLVPMDGFHLAQAELVRLGRADRKSAPDTFDAAGYTALLARLRAPEPGTTVYAPAFDRSWRSRSPEQSQMSRPPRRQPRLSRLSDVTVSAWSPSSGVTWGHRDQQCEGRYPTGSEAARPYVQVTGKGVGGRC